MHFDLELEFATQNMNLLSFKTSYYPQDCEPVKVVGIKYVIKPPRVACLRLACTNRRASFTVRYHDMPDVIDFLIPMQHYEAAVARGWSQGDR